MRRIFWGFCMKWVLMSRSNFWLRIRGDIHIPKTTPRFHRYGESPTPRSSETGSRQLPASLIHGVGHSPHHRYRESAGWIFLKKTLRIDDTESRQLCISPIRRVDNSPYRWVGESTTPRIGDTGSRYSKKKLIWCQFSELLTAKPCL
jgi:hypothetical protein